MAVELGRRDGKIAEVGAGLRMVLKVGIKDDVHHDRLECGSQRSGGQRRGGLRHTEFRDRKRSGIPQRHSPW
jgi:hypothetical protein